VRRLFAIGIALSLAAQDPQFGVQSRLVLVPVTVTDARGRSIDGLEPRDFVILDNGRPQTITVDTLATGVAPIALVVAVQSAGISAPVLAKTRKIGAMIQPLVTGERGCAALVSFDDRVQWVQDCTKDPEALSRAFYKLQPGEDKRARMLDAAHDAIEHLRRRSNVRRVLLLISESRDRGSETDLPTVMMDAQTAGVTIYAATYSAFKTAFTTKPSDAQTAPRYPKGPPLPRNEPESPPGHERVPNPPPEQRVDILGGLGELVRLGNVNSAQVLTTGTGGVTFSFTRQKGLEEAIEKLGTELHIQYVVSFTPDHPDPGYHRLEVRLARRGEFRIRARPGYWSAQ
jgi:VWFA-related protein